MSRHQANAEVASFLILSAQGTVTPIKIASIIAAEAVISRQK